MHSAFIEETIDNGQCLMAFNFHKHFYTLKLKFTDTPTANPNFNACNSHVSYIVNNVMSLKKEERNKGRKPVILVCWSIKRFKSNEKNKFNITKCIVIKQKKLFNACINNATCFSPPHRPSSGIKNTYLKHTFSAWRTEYTHKRICANENIKFISIK
jgi:hypothetical protein